MTLILFRSLETKPDYHHIHRIFLAHLSYLQDQLALLLVLSILAYHVHGRRYSLIDFQSHSLHSQEAPKHTHLSAIL